jgi:hypothetical protein
MPCEFVRTVAPRVPFEAVLRTAAEALGRLEDVLELEEEPPP